MSLACVPVFFNFVFIHFDLPLKEEVATIIVLIYHLKLLCEQGALQPRSISMGKGFYSGRKEVQ